MRKSEYITIKKMESLKRTALRLSRGAKNTQIWEGVHKALSPAKRGFLKDFLTGYQLFHMVRYMNEQRGALINAYNETENITLETFQKICNILEEKMEPAQIADYLAAGWPNWEEHMLWLEKATAEEIASWVAAGQP